MYIYLENNYFIPLNEIICIIDYESFLKEETGIEYLNINKKKIIDMSKEGKKTIIITNNYIYISTYTLKALKSRGFEFEKLKKKSQ